jgi:hypothetical protein
MFTLNKQFLFFNAKMAMKGGKKWFKGAQNRPKTGPKPAQKESPIKSPIKSG